MFSKWLQDHNKEPDADILLAHFHSLLLGYHEFNHEMNATNVQTHPKMMCQALGSLAAMLNLSDPCTDINYSGMVAAAEQLCARSGLSEVDDLWFDAPLPTLAEIGDEATLEDMAMDVIAEPGCNRELSHAFIALSWLKVINSCEPHLRQLLRRGVGLDCGISSEQCLQKITESIGVTTKVWKHYRKREPNALDDVSFRDPLSFLSSEGTLPR